ncbi:MAG: hypothetical protein ACOYKE_06245 [Ferruginibacter sp.]
MNERTKIMLSPQELELVSNTEWILTKSVIIQKVMTVFGAAATVMQTHSASHNEVFAIAPKIAKGENYEGLPYVMLDYPRLFSKQDICAIRTFFWWGNHFSVTLHVSGVWLSMVADKIAANYSNLAKQDFQLSVNDNPWKHQYSVDNMMYMSQLNATQLEAFIQQHQFLKIGKSIPVGQWDKVPTFIEETYATLMSLIMN